MFVITCGVRDPVQRPIPPGAGQRIVVFEAQTDDARSNTTCLTGYTQIDHILYTRHRMLVLEEQESASRRTVTDLSNCLGRNWRLTPTVDAGSAIHVPTAELLVRFRDGVSLQQASAFVAQKGLQVGDTSMFQALHRITVATGKPASESLAVARALSGFPIRSAEPNYLIIRKDR